MAAPSSVYQTYNTRRRKAGTPVADFVSCLSNQDPTSEDWENLLKKNGFTQSQIDNILN